MLTGLELPLWLKLVIPQFISVVLAVLGTLSLSYLYPGWLKSGWGILTMALLLLIAVWASIAIETSERNAQHRLMAGVARSLLAELDRADALLLAIEADFSRSDEDTLKRHQVAVEKWRGIVSRYLDRQLPDSGAGLRFRGGRGLPFGGMIFIYTYTNLLRSNLAAIIDNLESYLDRSGPRRNTSGTLEPEIHSVK